MTPHELLSKWRSNELEERSASQSHFNDLCAMLGVLDRVSTDPQGEWFNLEKGASKISGGEGWAEYLAAVQPLRTMPATTSSSHAS